MPRDISHVILADEVSKVIQNNDVFNNLDAFHMGCVADDSFLYTASPSLSTRLHGGLGDDTRVVVLEMIDQMKKEQDLQKASEQRAFIYGYLCHMATDFTFHPLIYSISGSQLKQNNRSTSQVNLSKACHRYAETWLDLKLMRDRNLSFHNFRPFRKIVTNIAMRVRLDDFFTDCYQAALKAKKQTWGDNFDLQSQFHNGMTRQFLIGKITQNQTISKILCKLDQVLHGRLKLCTAGFYDFEGQIPMRLNAGVFVHPVTGEMIRKSISDLEHDSVDCSVQFIRAADAYIKSGHREVFCENVPNVNLDTGIADSKLFEIRKRVNQKDFEEIMGTNRYVQISHKQPLKQMVKVLKSIYQRK